MSENKGITGFADRLKLVLKNESVNGFAERAGLKEGSIRQYLSGSTPGIDKASQIASAANVSLNWLITGESSTVSEELSQKDKNSDFSYIPELEISASAGNGSIAITETPKAMLAFSNTWLRSQNINPKTATTITARGDSMEPAIRDGDLLIVDTSIKTPCDNGIYIIIVNEMIFVKRIHLSQDGSITLLSENKIYPPEKILAKDTPDLILAGRVMWYGRSI